MVGQLAKRQAITNPHYTVFAAKRLIGRRHNEDVVQRDIPLMPYKIVKAKTGDAGGGTFLVRGYYYRSVC